MDPCKKQPKVEPQRSTQKLKVAILFGGKSGEHEVSITSAVSVASALDKNKYEVTMIGIDKAGRWVLLEINKLLNNKNNLRQLNLCKETTTLGFLPFKSNPSCFLLSQTVDGQLSSPLPIDRSSETMSFDVVIPVLHGTYGEDGTIQGLLELAEIPYVGCGVLGSALGMDKDMSRKLFQLANIPVVPWKCLRRYEFQKSPTEAILQLEKDFEYPYFVKPANMGSSVGVGKVKSREEAKEKINHAFNYDLKILIEKAIIARELEISILGLHEPRSSVIGEIIPTHEFYSYEAKYLDENGAHLKIPAENLSPSAVERIKSYATQAFQILEGRGLARVDFFLDKQSGEIYLNEVNTIPGFTSISMYPKLWEASGISYSQMLDELIGLAIESFREKNELKTSLD